mgnify:CR=1 FL=1
MCCEIVGCERGCGYECGCVSVDVRGCVWRGCGYEYGCVERVCGEGVGQSIETNKKDRS